MRIVYKPLIGIAKDSRSLSVILLRLGSMTDAEKDRIITSIACADVFVDTTYGGKPISLVLTPPTARDLGRSIHIYNTELLLACDAGMALEDEVLRHKISLGEWDTKTDFEIAGISEDIQKMKRGLIDLWFNKTQLEQTRATIRNAEKAMLKRLIAKSDVLVGSAEAHAKMVQQRFLLSKITKTLDDELLWKTRDDFDNCSDIAFINKLSRHFFALSHLETKVLRELSRTSPWRQMWKGSNAVDIFGKAANEWTYNQKELVAWSNTYDSIMEAYRRPPREVIDDDDLVDSWLMRESEKMDERSKGDLSSTVLPSSGRKSGRQEVFVMSDEDGAKNVYAMNDPLSRAKVRAQQRVVEQHGKIKDQNLPESQQQIRQKAMQERSQKIKDITRR